MKGLLLAAIAICLWVIADTLISILRLLELKL